MAAEVICLFAEKGGVGRTTTAINLASELAKNHRVLLIDTDSQASLSKFLLGADTVDRLHKSQTIAGLFDDAMDPSLDEIIVATELANVSLLPSSSYLKEHNLPNPHQAGDLQYAVADLVGEVAEDFAYILLDTPPDIGNLPAWSCLLASHFVLTPIVPETFSAQSIAGVDSRLAQAQEYNPRLRFLGYIVNLRKTRSSYHAVNEERLRAIHGDRVLTTVLSNLTAFSEAQGFRQPVASYAPSSKAACQTAALAAEIVARIKHSNAQRKVA